MRGSKGKTMPDKNKQILIFLLAKEKRDAK